MDNERHVLVVFPHPDDEAFGVSGTIASHIKNGTPVTYACLTLGEMGRNMGNPPFCNRETLPDVRRQELQHAANVLGIKDLRMLGYRDKTIEFENEEKIVAHLGSIIDEVKPTLIISFYPGYSVHPDHDATGAAVIKAVKQLPEKGRPKLNLVAFSKNCMDELGEPDIVNDVHAVITTKIDAIKAHRSQTQLMVADMEEKLKQQDPKMLAWLQNERFWSYVIE